jgi:hypothetical protein
MINIPVRYSKLHGSKHGLESEYPEQGLLIPRSRLYDIILIWSRSTSVYILSRSLYTQLYCHQMPYNLH